MLINCPYCNLKHDGQLRCQQCQQRLTEWMNWDTYAEEAQLAAANNAAATIANLEHATIFDPDSPHRFAQLGNALADAEQAGKANMVLQYAEDRFPDAAEIVALADRLRTFGESVSEPS